MFYKIDAPAIIGNECSEKPLEMGVNLYILPNVSHNLLFLTVTYNLHEIFCLVITMYFFF